MNIMQHQQQAQKYNASRRTMSVNPIDHQPLKWDLSNLTIGSPSREECQQPDDPSSQRRNINSPLSHAYDGSGSGQCSFASYPSPIQYPSPSEIPACLDVDDIFDKLRGAQLLKQGRLANPQLVGLAKSRDSKPYSKLLNAEKSSRSFEAPMATSLRTSPGLGGEQRPSLRESSQSPDPFRSIMMQRMERGQDGSDDPMEEMSRRGESFRRGHHQDEDHHRSRRQNQDEGHHRSRRQQEEKRREDPFQRTEDRNRMRSKQDDDNHQQSRRDESYHDRSSRREDDDDYHRPTATYDDYDRSNDHKINKNRPSSRDRYRRDDDFHRPASCDDYPSPRSSQQQDGRNRRQENSYHSGAREDSYDEGGYRRQEDYQQRGGGSSRDEYRRHDSTHDNRRPPQDDYNSRRYYNDEQQTEDYSDQDDHQDQIIVEVTPGHFVPLRGSAETWAAVQNGRIRTTTCFICMSCLVCVDDADMVMCPGCRSISPVEGGGGGGLGLGMRKEDASTELKRLEGKSRMVGGLYS